MTLKKIHNLLIFLIEKKNIKIENRDEMIESIKNIKNSEEFRIKKEELKYNKIKKEIYDIRIKSIESTIYNECYFKKEEKDGFYIYYYKNKIILFLKDEYINKELEEEIKKNKYSTIVIYYLDINKKEKYKKIKKESIEEHLKKKYLKKIILYNL